jgi:NitT/TauT family transport system substrate-binding protein
MERAQTVVARGAVNLRYAILFSLLALSHLLLCCACGCRQQQVGGPGDGAVTLALNWFPEAEHGGFYAAQQHGYFAEEEVDIQILPGGPGAPVVQQVAAGRVAFGVTNADQVLLGREQGAPVVAVMTAMQESPRCIMVHASSKLESLYDLNDLTLSVGSGKPYARFLLSKLNDAQLTIVPYQGNVTAFLQQKDYAQQAYVFSEPYVARQQGAEPRCLMLSEIGFNPYSSVLITSETMITQRPELVAKVVRASIRGWQQYLDDPQQTNQHIHSLNSEMGLDVLAYGAAAIQPLCLPDGARPEQLGTMSADRWQQLAEQLAEIDLLKDAGIWKGAFDLRFLEQVAGYKTGNERQNGE